MDSKKVFTVPSDILEEDSVTTNALIIIHKAGVENAEIPEPKEANILADRIYFITNDGANKKAWTAFLYPVDGQSLPEVSVVKGWQIEAPAYAPLST